MLRRSISSEALHHTQAAKLSIEEGSCVNEVHLATDARFAFIEFRSVLEVYI